MAMNDVTKEVKEYNKKIVALIKEIEADKKALEQKQAEIAEYEPISRAAMMTVIEAEIMEIFNKQKIVEEMLITRSIDNGAAKEFLEKESEKRASESEQVVNARAENDEISATLEGADKAETNEEEVKKLEEENAKKKEIIEKIDRLKVLETQREEIVEVKKKYEQLQKDKEKIEKLIKKNQKNKDKLESLEAELASIDGGMIALRNSNPDLFNGEEYDDSMLQEVRNEEGEIYQFLKDNGIKNTKDTDKIVEQQQGEIDKNNEAISKLYTPDQIAEMKARVVDYAITKQGAEIGISYEEARKRIQDKFFANEELVMEGMTIELTEEKLKDAAIEHLKERDEKALEETIAEPEIIDEEIEEQQTEEKSEEQTEEKTQEYDESTATDKKRKAEGPQQPVNPNQSKGTKETQDVKRNVNGVSQVNYQASPASQTNMRNVAADYRGREFPNVDVKGKSAFMQLFIREEKIKAEKIRIAAAMNYGNPDFKMPTDTNSVQYKEYKEKLRLYAELHKDDIKDSLKKGYNLHEMAMDSKVSYKQLELAKKAIKKEGFRERIKVEPVLEAAKERIETQAKTQTKDKTQQDEGR